MKYFKRKKLKQIWESENGFSLTELMVTVAILTVVSFAIWGVIDNGLRVQRTVENAVAAQDNARVALERLSKEIRARKDFLPGSSNLTASQIKFRKVTDDENSVRTITYYLTGPTSRQQLLRQDETTVDGVTTTTTTTIADYIVNLPTDIPISNNPTRLFTYYDEDGNEITTVSNRSASTRTVRILLDVMVSPESERGEFVVQSDVTLRN